MLQHSSTYNTFKQMNKKENDNPSNIKFWQSTAGKRKELLKQFDEVLKLLNKWSSETNIESKNDILREIHVMVTKMLNTVRNYKQYFETRFLFMKVEKILIAKGINPVDIRASMEEEKVEENINENVL